LLVLRPGDARQDRHAGDPELRRDAGGGRELAPRALPQPALALVRGDLLDGGADRGEEVLAAEAVLVERGPEGGGDSRGIGDEPGSILQEERQVDELEAEELHDPDPLVLPRYRRERVLAAGDARGRHVKLRRARR